MKTETPNDLLRAIEKSPGEEFDLNVELPYISGSVPDTQYIAFFLASHGYGANVSISDLKANPPIVHVSGYKLR